MNRRDWLRCTTGSVLAAGVSSWLPPFAAHAADDPQRKRSCILLWMSGGPSQIDTFDPKPEHANGGPFKSRQTAVPGITIGEHLPEVAARLKHLAIVRSMSTKEGDHGRASLHLRNGYLPQGPIEFPTFGALVAKEREALQLDLPGYVSIAPRGVGSAALTAGFLGPRFAPLIVGGQPNDNLFYDNSDGSLRVENLGLPAGISKKRAGDRLELLHEMEDEFLNGRPGTATASHRGAYDRAVKLMRESAARAFDLSDEKDKLRDQYGRNRFGQGCLLARRLVERGVPFVEVTLGGWDTHDNNFKQVQSLCQTLDPAWSTLMDDLKDRGLLDSTLIVWMGEFGRTPVINPRQGRDHFPMAWTVCLAGGGIKGGQAMGRTSTDCMEVEERPVAVPDLLATVSLALGIDPMKQNMSNVGRPIRVVDPSAKAMREVLA
jgi:hypothetical protein